VRRYESLPTAQRLLGQSRVAGFSLWDSHAFGVHALACLMAADTLKREHRTPPIRRHWDFTPGLTWGEQSAKNLS